MNVKDKIIIALDFSDKNRALSMVDKLGDLCGFYKIGLELYTAVGPSIVKEILDRGKDVFLDLKLNDIPNTVGKTASIVGKLGVKMFNVHALGGKEMMIAAKEESRKSAIESGKTPPIVIAVTVLTSITSDILVDEMRILSTAENQAIHLARLAKDSGLDGVVCSSYEVENIKDACGSDFLTITPGIRLDNSNSNDQKRVSTPQYAIEIGADYMVIGRPVTQSNSPSETLKRIIDSIEKNI